MNFLGWKPNFFHKKTLVVSKQIFTGPRGKQRDKGILVRPGRISAYVNGGMNYWEAQCGVTGVRTNIGMTGIFLIIVIFLGGPSRN